jgi:hypothetical protein
MLGKVRFEAVSSKLVDAESTPEETTTVVDRLQPNKPSITERCKMKLHNAMSHPSLCRLNPCTHNRLIISRKSGDQVLIAGLM